MDAIGNDWNTAPACVLSTVWGTASIRDLAVEVGAVPASPIRQVLTWREAGGACRQSSARASLWICGQHKSVAHKPTGTTAATENLNNLEISSVRTTPGSPSQAALNATMHGCYDLSAIYTRVLIAVHTQARTALIRAKDDRGRVKAAQAVLTSTTADRDALVARLQAANSTTAQVDGVAISATGEFAAVQFIAGATGASADTVAHAAILTISAVPDVLAVLLLLAAGYSSPKAPAAPVPVKARKPASRRVRRPALKVIPHAAMA